jgi:hypothetical protein
MKGMIELSLLIVRIYNWARWFSVLWCNASCMSMLCMVQEVNVSLFVYETGSTYFLSIEVMDLATPITHCSPWCEHYLVLWIWHLLPGFPSGCLYVTPWKWQWWSMEASAWGCKSSVRHAGWSPSRLDTYRPLHHYCFWSSAVLFN